jgi:dTMP kinase
MGSRAGIFVTLEGGEGSGKTTQCRRIVAHLRSLGRTVLETREPGGTEAGELIRDILLHRVSALSPRAELALYLASRAQLVEEVLRPHLGRGFDVVCDRFTDSSLAYQGGGRGLGVDRVREMNDWATAELSPDVTFFFDAPAATGLERKEKRAGGRAPLDRIERESRAFHELVRRTYLAIAERESHRFRVIPTQNGEEDVWTRVRAALDEVLSTRRGAS